MMESVICIKEKEVHVLLPHECKATRYYYLHDRGQSHGSDINMGLALDATKSIVFSSPDSNNYKSYHNECILSAGVLGVEVFMPTWSWDELKLCQKYVHTHLTVDLPSGEEFLDMYFKEVSRLIMESLFSQWLLQKPLWIQ